VVLRSALHPIRGLALAAAEEHRGSERRSDGETHGVPAGALSALLEELARASDARPDDLREVGLRPGAIIGRFELLREIGRGGFGVVYEARDRELRRSVAFKLVRPGRLEIGEDQLRREAEVIAQLSHPNLVTLFDVGRCEHGPYLILELLRGETLEQRLARGPVPAREAVRLASAVAMALGHAHSQGVVHRDLKPSNVFLCQGGQVKLLDFGMSHAFGRRRVEGGTPAYMAPEQWRGAPEDERTDVFALGVMLFRMLANELPFPAEDGGKDVLSTRRAPALEVPGEPALGALLGRMLEKDPTARPRDGAEVLAALAAVQEELEPAKASSVALVRRVRPSLRRAAALLAAGVLLGAGALAAARLLWGRVTTPERARAIAVLPFANLSESPDNEYFSDGLAEEIRNLLTRLRELKVAASSSSLPFKDRKVNVADVAQRLRVDVVLEGSVRRERDRLRVAAELIDAHSGFRMWSQTYDRRIEDVFAIQDDIARQVVGALELVLSRASESAFQKPHAASVAAYDLYLRGRAFLRLPPSPQSLDQAIALLEQAVAADGQFAQAHAGLCDAWLARYELGRASQSFEQAEAACRRALDRDREDGEVYVALGNLHLSSGRYPEAEREFQQATAMANGTSDALLGLARAYQAQGRLAEAERTFEQAKVLDPGYWRASQLLGHFFVQGGRYAEAAQAYGEEIARTPDNASAHNNLGAAYYLAGDFERAAKAWQASLALAPTTGAYSNVGSSYYYLGRFEEAAAMYAKAVELAPEDYRMWGNLGDAYAQAAGREADAAAALRKAVALGEKRLRINPADADAMSDLAHYLASLGRATQARQLNEQALGRDPQNNYIHYNAALVRLRLGEPDAALSEIERAVELGYQRQLLPQDPGLAALRREKRFEALIAPLKR
jgi:serine/threonine protein kinase/Flp pilus assembly protein TadD